MRTSKQGTPHVRNMPQTYISKRTPLHKMYVLSTSKATPLHKQHCQEVSGRAPGSKECREASSHVLLYAEDGRWHWSSSEWPCILDKVSQLLADGAVDTCPAPMHRCQSCTQSVHLCMHTTSSFLTAEAILRTTANSSLTFINLYNESGK